MPRAEDLDYPPERITFDEADEAPEPTAFNPPGWRWNQERRAALVVAGRDGDKSAEQIAHELGKGDLFPFLSAERVRAEWNRLRKGLPELPEIELRQRGPDFEALRALLKDRGAEV